MILDFLQLLKDRSDEVHDSTVESSFESVSQKNGNKDMVARIQEYHNCV